MTIQWSLENKFMRENPLAKYNTLGLRGPANVIEREKLSTRIANLDDWEKYKKIRIQAVETDPDSFSYNDKRIRTEKILPDENWKLDLIGDRFVILSDYEGETIGLSRAKKSKNEEGVWGVHSVFVR